MEDEYRGLLARFHDGELTGETARAVALHVASCPECHAELQALRSLSAKLATDLAAANLTAAAEPGAMADAEAFWQALQPRLGAQKAAIPWRSWLPGLLLLGLQGVLGLLGALLSIGPLLTEFTGLGTDLPGLPLPGFFTTGLFGWAGVLYLVWLVVWWSRYQAESLLSHA